MPSNNQLTLGSGSGKVEDTLAIELYDGDVLVGTISIGIDDLEDATSAGNTTTIEFAEAASKLARAEGTGDGDGDGKLLKGTTIAFDVKSVTLPADGETIKIGGKEFTFKTSSATGTNLIDVSSDAGDRDVVMKAFADAIKADGKFDAVYDKDAGTLTLTTTEDYDDVDALQAALNDGQGGDSWAAGLTLLKDIKTNGTVTPFDDGDNDDDTGAGGGYYEIDMQIGDSSKGYDTMTIKILSMSTGSIGVKGLDISTIKTAHDAIDTIKDAINTVSSVRGQLGAYQNRLEHTANNLSVMTENIQDAESTIRDTDVAEEMMAYTKNNILIQSAQAMLAQANAVPQGVLQLLG